jgi:hypothetical protein
MPTAQPNNYYSTFYPIASGDTDRKFKLVRPTTLQWSQLNTTIRPLSGQAIRSRETAEVLFTLTGDTQQSAIWDNRFTREVFIGHYQITRLGSYSDTTIVTERGQIIGTKLQNTFSYSWHFQREYDLNLHLNKTDKNAAFLTAITNCNADLAPGPVPNNFINSDNVIAYVRAAFGYTIEDFPNIQDFLNAIALPVTSGYRFPNSVLFRGINNIPSVNLDGYEISTRLGDVELWVHPDWTIDPAFTYTFEVINYKVLDQTLDQFPDDTTCTYPSTVNFP